MKKILCILSVFIFSMAFLSADELMENMKNASDQVSKDLSLIIGNDNVFVSSITYNNIPVVMGDLFSDLLANRLLDNSQFEGSVIKGYSPGNFRISDANWIVSGSVYKAGSSYFLSLYLKNSQGMQKKGWEFLIPGSSSETLLEQSKMAISQDGDIYEPNNNSTEAVELLLDPDIEMINLKIDNGIDEDWFYIDLEESSAESSMFLLTAYTTGSLDTYMEIFSPEDTSYPVAENDDGDNDSNAKISYAISETGRWYIKVKGYSSDETGEYGLNVSIETREVGPGEPDNSLEEASLLEIEGTRLRRSIDYSEDYDFYKIVLDDPLPENRVLVIQTYGNLDLSMTLFDDYENEIMSNDDSGDDSNPQIMITDESEGVWYVAVYPYDGDSIGAYSIKTYFMEVVKDEYEDDNTMDSAGLLEVNGTAQQRTFMPADDQDWVRFVVESPGDFIIRTTGPIDTQITLYDNYGEYVMDDDDSGKDNNALISEFLDEGVYYLQVVQYEENGNVEDSYTLSIRKY